MSCHPQPAPYSQPEQITNTSSHDAAAAAHDAAAVAHETAALSLTASETEAACAATERALCASGPGPAHGPLPAWFVAAFRGVQWSSVAFSVRAGASPISQLKGHLEAALGHRDAAREHRTLDLG